jgi:hypothetical protein
MERRIPCFCDNSFTVEVPEEIDLDLNPGYMDEIQNGSFMNFPCPSCGKKHKPEFPLTVLWPGKNLRFEVFPELERGEFYRRKKEAPYKGPEKKETIIGYPELADRLAVIRDGLEPAAVEAIKYYLHIKAEEHYPDDEMEIWYASSSPEHLEFHIHGIRQYEVAIMKVPRSTYEKTLDDFLRNPKSEIFSSLRVRSYLSVKNTMRPEELK